MSLRSSKLAAAVYSRTHVGPFMVAACITITSGNPPSAAATAQTAKEPEETKLRCKRYEETGSFVKKRRVSFSMGLE